MRNKINKSQLQLYYNKGNSLSETAYYFRCSIHKIQYWMKKYNIKTRNINDALYIKNNRYGDPYKIKQLVSFNDYLLFGLGIGLYWGEGNKTNKHCIRVANTDPIMLIMFRKFLSEICNVKKEKFHYSIVTFKDQAPYESKKYWSKKLNVMPNIFGKIVQIPPQGHGTHKKKSQFGVCTLTVCNVKLKTWLNRQLTLTRTSISPDSSVVEHLLGK